MLIIDSYRFAAPVAINSSLLLHFNGTNGSTTFTDNSANNFSFTAQGAAALTTSTMQFGSASLGLGGSGAYVTGPNSSLFVPTGDWTMDFWFYRNVTNTFQVLASYGFDNADLGWMIFLSSTGTGNKLTFWAYDSGQSSAISLTGGSQPSGSTWHHAAITRSGNSWKLFFNGSNIGSTTNTWSDRPTMTSYLLSLGAWPDGVSKANINLDEFRIVSGTAVWTSAFSTPSSEYTT